MPTVSLTAKPSHVSYSNYLIRFPPLPAPGKKKKGGFWIQEPTPLCAVILEDGSEHMMYGATNGRLVELNPRLKTNPGKDGYIH